MSRNFLIIITGLPCTGKSTLGRRISKEFSIPFISKDDFKETMFDNLDYDNHNWSQKIGKAIYDIFWNVMEESLKVNKPLIVETNFYPEFANPKFLSFQEKYNCTPLQIRCHTKGELLFERFKKRAHSKGRHPGHGDISGLKRWEPILLKGKIEPLDIGGFFIDIDTTDFEEINYQEIFATIRDLEK